MPIFDLFSKRKRRAAQVGQPEIYRYEPIPEPFKVKIVYILRDAIGVITNYGPHEPAENWRLIHDVIAREKGRFELANYGTYDTCCIEWFMRTRDTEDALDFIDVSFRVVDRVIGDLETWQRERQGVKLTRSEAIEELLLLRHRIG